MLDDIRLTLYQLAVKFLHIKFCLTHTSRIEIRKKYSVIPLLNQIWLRCYSVSIDDLFYTTFRPYTTKAHSYLGALVVVF